MRAPIMAIAIIIAAVEMAKYVSVGVEFINVYGDGVDAALPTPM